MHKLLFLIAASAVLCTSPAHAQFSGFLNTLRQIRSTINEVNGGVREAKRALRDTSSTVKETTSVFTNLCSTLGVSCDKSNSQDVSRSSSSGQMASSSELNRIYATWYQSLSQDEKEAAQFIVMEAAQGSKTDFKKFSTSSWFTSKPVSQQSRYASIFFKASEVISSAEKGGSKEKFLGYAFCIHSGSQTCL